MRSRILAASMVVMAVGFAVVASASTVTGSIETPTIKDPSALEVAERAAACSASQGHQGKTGWLLPSSQGRLYTISPASGPADAAFAIAFYSTPPTCSSAGTLIARSVGGANQAGSFANPTGTVPFSTTIGIVTLIADVSPGILPAVSGQPGTGFNYRES